MGKILITAESFGNLSAAALDLIAASGFPYEVRTEVESLHRGREEALLPLVGDVEGLIVGGKSCITRNVIDRAAALRMISKRGVGVDNIDVLYAKTKGIVVANTPHVVHRTVADHAMALMLGLAKNLAVHDRDAREGRWAPGLWSAEVSGKTLGIIGLGLIGKSLAVRALAFDMIVVAHDPGMDERFVREHSILSVGMEELLGTSDFVSVHVPLTPGTRGLIGPRELSLMKPTAYLVNTSRGGTLDETALIDALQSGRIAGAGLDVFEREPLPERSPLRSLSNVLLTPHVASTTRECFLAMEMAAAEHAISILRGHMPRYTL
jgi:phosphoglycerate dehydrogenase-like enzyme